MFLGEFRSISLVQNVGQTEYIMGDLKILTKKSLWGKLVPMVTLSSSYDAQTKGKTRVSMISVTFLGNIE